MKKSNNSWQPPGRAANAAACLIFIAAVTGASRRSTFAAYALAAGVAVAVVTLGYHWPTDAIAGWGLGTFLGCAGRALVSRAAADERGERGVAHGDRRERPWRHGVEGFPEGDNQGCRGSQGRSIH